MGLLCDYFTAASNAQAAETIDWIGGPANPPRPSGLARSSRLAARPAVSLPEMGDGRIIVSFGHELDDGTLLPRPHVHSVVMLGGVDGVRRALRPSDYSPLSYV